MEFVVDLTKIARAYAKGMLYIVRIQRAWRKYLYGPRPNLTRLILRRQLSGKPLAMRHVRKRMPAADPAWCWAEGLVINPW